MRIAVCGYGGHGKGTVSAFLTLSTRLKYKQSTSQAAADLVVFDKLKDKYGYSTPEEAWNDRHNHRGEWAEIIWEYNLESPTGLKLYEEMFAENDILDGVRKSEELRKLKDLGYIDMTIWVDALGREPREPLRSCQITADDCDLVIDNNGDLESLKKQLLMLVETRLRPVKKKQ